MNIQELKARAYDLLVTIEQAQRELQQVNQTIAQALAEQAKEESKKKPVKTEMVAKK